MDDVVRADLIDVLEGVLFCIEKKNSDGIKELSERAIDTASKYDSTHALKFAVLLYAASKILGRCGFTHGVCVDIKKGFLRAKQFLERGDDASVEREVKKLFKQLSASEKKFRSFVDYVVESAQTKKGAGLYKRGVSLARAAELLGISRWELMQYVGKTRIVDEDKVPLRVKDRLNFARRLFS
ncbi:hypothetical protein D6774_04710 [Candidatus Woesearchaeota archaeon]|nr:MAG: hypothetical protein D6774_04710 [Candidatus Woesearchaeota archaeon]